MEEVTIYNGNKPNFNTLSKRGMRVLGGIGDNVSEIAIKHREENFFKSIADVNEVLDVMISLDALVVSSIPEPNFRISLMNKDGRRQRWVGIRFTPSSGLGPWQIDYNVSFTKLNTDFESSSSLERSGHASDPPPIFR